MHVFENTFLKHQKLLKFCKLWSTTGNYSFRFSLKNSAVILSVGVYSVAHIVTYGSLAKCLNYLLLGNKPLQSLVA